MHNSEEQRKRSGEYASWNKNVYDSIQRQLETILNPVDRGLAQSLAGQKSVDFTLPEVPPTTKSNNYKDNPAYAQLNQNYREMRQRREMDLLLDPEGKPDGITRGMKIGGYPYGGNVERAMKRDFNHGGVGGEGSGGVDERGNDLQKNVLNQLNYNDMGYNDGENTRDIRIARSRPVLEPDLWEQGKLQVKKTQSFLELDL